MRNFLADVKVFSIFYNFLARQILKMFLAKIFSDEMSSS